MPLVEVIVKIAAIVIELALIAILLPMLIDMLKNWPK